MEGTPSRPKFVRWAVMLGIVIALNLFFFAGRSLVIPAPEFNDYCPSTPAFVSTEETCVEEGGVWIETKNGVTAPEKTTIAPYEYPAGYCDFYSVCQPEYDTAYKNHQLVSFVVMTGFGVLAIILGVLPLGASIVSAGLSYGGVLALIIAAIGYWNDAGTIVQLLISTVALGALIYLGIRRFKD